MNHDNKTIASLREDYTSKKIRIQDFDPNPIQQFASWFEEALNSSVKEPNAMTLATASKLGRPAARIILLKGFDENGFIFYTSYKSRKGKELEENPYTALVFFWKELQRQVRIEGSVEKISKRKSAKYFQSRPKSSQIGAWASAQSQVIKNREVLERNVESLEIRYAEETALPKPPNWGGYLVNPTLIEFWQGQPSRLHDRIRYTKKRGNKWIIERLAP